MKHERGFVQAFLLAMACAGASVGCLVTAFGMEITAAWNICLIWAGCCVVFMCLCVFRRGGWYLAGLDVLLCIWLVWDGTVLHSLLCLMRVIARAYDGGYQWGIPDFLRERIGSVELGALLLGIPVLQSVCTAVLRRRGTGMAVLLMLASLTSCLVLTDTVPSPLSLFGMLLCLTLLMITEHVRAESRGQGARLTVRAVIPAVLVLGLLFGLNPRESYANPAKELREQTVLYLRQTAEKLFESGMNMLNGTRTPPKVELSSLASQPQLGIPVAEAAAERTGTVYLRLRDYDVYTGTAWVSTEERYENISGTGQPLGAVVVRELTTQSGRLLPSFPEGDTVVNDGFAVREEEETVYRVECMEEAMSARPGGNWLALPEQTALRAGALLSRIPGNWNDTRSAAEVIASYVRQSAAYSRQPGAMPERETDFALWFLESADKGFCVHFASAAAVLLRSAGIPARYVTGYRIHMNPGQTTHITSDDAHAWVEYYDYGTWTWVILEATPGTGTLELTSPETEPSVPQTAPQPTTPPENTVPTTPTQRLPMEPPGAPEKTAAFPVRYLLWALALCLLAALPEGQRLLRIRLRMRKQGQGINNRRAVEKWQEVCLLYRILNEHPPEKLEALAEKAVYSQHALTGEELNRFRICAALCRRELKKHPWWKRLVYRYWYAVL